VKPAQKRPADNAFKQDWCRDTLQFSAMPRRVALPTL
jgi:hypothetical protein